MAENDDVTTLMSEAGNHEEGSEEEDADIAAPAQEDTLMAAAAKSKEAGWTLTEEATLVKHMQNIFEPNFDASEIISLLPEKYEDDIKEKWRELSSSLLSMLSKRKQDGDQSNTKNDTSPKKKSPKKKQKTDSTEKWSEDELERLIDVMEEYSSKFISFGVINKNFT